MEAIREKALICQLPEKMLLKLLIMVNFRSFLRLLLKHFPDLTAG